MSDTMETETTMVIAEDAPIGVQLWPTTDQRYAGNYTLTCVTTVTRTARWANVTQETTKVVWTYESGRVDIYDLHELVACRIHPSDLSERTAG